MPRVLARRALILLTTAVLALPSGSALAAAPANDDFAAAELVDGAPASATGTTAEATLQSGEPNHAYTSLGRSVWYRWVAPRSGTAVADTAGSTSATTLSAYTGTDVAALTRHASAGAADTSRIQFPVTAGAEYHFVVDLDYGTPGGVQLNVDVKDPPPGDLFAAPVVLTGTTASVTNDNALATSEIGEPSLGGRNSLWHEWTAPASGAVALDTAGSAFNTEIGVFTGDALGTLTLIAHNDDAQYGTKTSRAGFQAVAGTTYRIYVDGNTASAKGPLALSLRMATAPPLNDAFAAPALLPSERTVSVTGDAMGALIETGEPSHYPYDRRGSVWHSWTAPADGSLTIRATPGMAGFTPVLAAYTGTTVTGLTRVANQAQAYDPGPQQIRIRVEAGRTYSIALEAYGVAGEYKLELELIDSPVNDDLANSLPLVGLVADVAGNTVGATQEPCEPVHDDNYYDPSVWFSWTAPASGGVTIDTDGSDFPTVLGIYTGETMCALQRVVVNRITGRGVPAKRSFRATAGVTYRIALDGAAARTGNYKLALRHSPPPLNDLLADATPLTGMTANVSGSLLGATGEVGETNPGGQNGATVWYRWTAPSTGPATLKLKEQTFTGGITVHSGEAIGSLTQVARGNYGETTFRARAGSSYLISVDGGTAPNHGDFKLDLTHVAAPPNDDFVAATPLTGASLSVTGTNVGATAEPGEPTVSYAYGTNSIWYSWTAPTSGTVAIDTEGSSFDTVLGVYTGTSVGALTWVASNNDFISYSKTHSRVTFRATAGTTYRVMVNSSYYHGGEVKLRLSLRSPPANDAFAMAQPLPSAPAASVVGATLGATAETGEPSHYSYDAARASVWYSWTAPSGGALTIRATGDFQPVIAAYTGSAVTSLTRVRNQPQDWNGGPEQIRVRVEAGTTYYIAIDARGSLGGDFNLTLQLVPSPPNDDFSKPEEITGLVADVAGSTVGATQEPCEPVHDNNYYDPSVWFKWTAPASGAVTLDTAGSEFSTVVAVYTGDDLCKLLRAPLRRMTGTGTQAKRGFRAVAGQTYRIAVDGLNAKMGNYKLSLRHQPPPANDMLADAQELTGNPATASGSNFGATGEIGEPGGDNGATVWYRWTAPATGLARLELPTSDFTARVTAYSGDSATKLVRESGEGYYSYNNSRYFRAIANQTYRIAVDGGSAPTMGDFTLKLTSLAAPANDDFHQPAVISGEKGTIDGTTTGATTEENEPGSNYYKRGSVWYSWTAPKTGLVTLKLPVTTSASPAIGVYQGDGVRALTEVRGGSSFRAKEGETYRIVVWSAATVDNGGFRMSWEMIPPPANDAFGAATELKGSTVSVPGTTTGATREDNEPASYSYYSYDSGATVWYSWTAPATGLASVRSTNGTVAAYTGDALGSLDLVGQTRYDNINFRAVAGRTYRIRVEGSDVSTGGGFTLSVVQVPPPSNDDFENAATFTGTATGTTTGATKQDGEQLYDSYRQATVWYSWTPESSGTAVVGTTGSRHTTAIYSGDSLTALSLRGASSSSYNGARFRVHAGRTYRIAVSRELSTYSSSFTLNASVLPGPPNDDFADAENLVGLVAATTGTNVNATREDGEPYHSYSARASVWYRWTAPISGRVTVDLSGSGYDTTLFAYEGSAVGSLKQLSYDNDSGDGSTSKLTIEARAGKTYNFAVDGYYGSSGAIKLALSTTPAPVNDDFAAAIELSGSSAATVGTNVGATHEPGEPENYYGSTGGSVWYSWTAERAGRVTLDLAGSGFSSTYGIYEGSSVGALVKVKAGYTNGPITFDPVRGRTYRISIDGQYSASGGINLSLAQAEAPANDEIDRAVVISGSAALVAGTNVSATRAPDEPRGGYSYPSGSVWYRWTAPASGMANFSLEGFGGSALTNVYAGTTFTDATPIAWGSTSLRFYATAGTTYSVSVAGAYGGQSAFKLRLEVADPPANDLFANAKPLSGSTVDVSGSTRWATQESCEPVHDDNYYDPSVWFSWKAPANGQVTLDTTGSGFNTVLGIYTGDYLCSLARVAVTRLTGAGVPAKRSFQAVKDVTYRIAVDGAGGATGNYVLALRHVADPEPKQEAAITAAPPPAPPPEPPSEQGSGETEVEQPTGSAGAPQETAPLAQEQREPESAAVQEQPPLPQSPEEEPMQHEEDTWQQPAPQEPAPQEPQQTEPQQQQQQQQPPATDPPADDSNPFGFPPSDPAPPDPAPSDPAPSNPAPSDPTPADPAPSDPPASPRADEGPSDPPSEPAPSQGSTREIAPPPSEPSGQATSDPAPSDPAPRDTAPSDPTPSDPAPTDPAPSDPAPSDPAPSDPAPSDPAPSDAGSRSAPSPGAFGWPAPAADPPATPSKPSLPLRLTASLAKQRLRDVLANGLAGSATCTTACSLEVTLVLDPAAARNAKLRGSNVTTARLVTDNVGGQGPTRFVVRLSKSARAKLAKAKLLPLTVKVVATSGTDRAEQTLRLKLKR